MQIISCGKGHYYNPELYSECPECAKKKELKKRIYEDYVYCPDCRILLDNLYGQCPQCGGSTKMLMQGDEVLFSTLTLWKFIDKKDKDKKLEVSEIIQWWYENRGIRLSEKNISVEWDGQSYSIVHGDDNRREIEVYDADHQLIRRIHKTRDTKRDEEKTLSLDEDWPADQRRMLHFAVEEKIFNAINRSQLQVNIENICHLLVGYRGNLSEYTDRNRCLYPTGDFDPERILWELRSDDRYREYLRSLDYMNAFPSDMQAAEVLCKLSYYQSETAPMWGTEAYQFAKNGEILKLLMRLDDLLAKHMTENSHQSFEEAWERRNQYDAEWPQTVPVMD